MARYIEERIQRTSGEQIVYLTHLSLTSFLPQYVAAGACFIAALGTLFMLPPEGPTAQYTLFIALVPAAIGLIIIIKVTLTFYTTEIGLTDHRVMMKTGFVARSTPEMKLEKIEMQQLEQGAAGRLFGYGTLHVRGAGDENMIIRNVVDPVMLTDQITDAIDRRQEAIRQHTRRADSRAETELA